MFKRTQAEFCCDLCLEAVKATDLHVRLAAEVGTVRDGQYVSTSQGVRIFGLFHVSCIEATRDNPTLALEVPYLTEAREILDGTISLEVDESPSPTIPPTGAKIIQFQS